MITYFTMNKPNHIQDDMLDVIIMHVLDKFGVRETHTVNVLLHFNNQLPITCGFITPTYEDHYDQDFIISVGMETPVGTKYPLAKFMYTLIHELVHLKQHLLGELRCNLKGELMWKNSHRDEFIGVAYRDLPWEQEAYMMEHIIAGELIERINAGEI